MLFKGDKKMKAITTQGLNPMVNPFMPKEMVVRTEKTGNFATLSIADEDNNQMLQIIVNDEVKKMLKEVIK